MRLIPPKKAGEFERPAANSVYSVPEDIREIASLLVERLASPQHIAVIVV